MITRIPNTLGTCCGDFSDCCRNGIKEEKLRKFARGRYKHFSNLLGVFCGVLSPRIREGKTEEGKSMYKTYSEIERIFIPYWSA